MNYDIAPSREIEADIRLMRKTEGQVPSFG